MKFTGAIVGLAVVAVGVGMGRIGAALVARNLDPAVVQRADAYAEAVLSGDPGRVAAFYVENGIEMAPNRAWAEGRGAIQALHQEFCSGPVKMTGFSFTHLESTIAGDTAYDVGTYRQTMTAPGAPAPIQDTGKYVAILKRSGGEWKAAYVIYNSDRTTEGK
jgi:ketosteroid isomerase-like protein